VSKTGAELIAEERARQISDEGWTKGHDKQHRQQELVAAAICYAWPPHYLLPMTRVKVLKELWPWHINWWKPSFRSTDDKASIDYIADSPADRLLDSERDRLKFRNRIRDLVKAGALIAAEIDRIKSEMSDDDSFGDMESELLLLKDEATNE
jgi:hypothetical protein